MTTIIAMLSTLNNNDGLTLTRGEPITYKTGWQVADYGMETSSIKEAAAEIMRMQTYDTLYDMVDQLPSEQREMFYLHYFEGLTFREIAEIMGVSINTALGRMRYAILNLRKMSDFKVL